MKRLVSALVCVLLFVTCVTASVVYTAETVTATSGGIETIYYQDGSGSVTTNYSNGSSEMRTYGPGGVIQTDTYFQDGNVVWLVSHNGDGTITWEYTDTHGNQFTASYDSTGHWIETWAYPYGVGQDQVHFDNNGDVVWYSAIAVITYSHSGGVTWASTGVDPGCVFVIDTVSGGWYCNGTDGDGNPYYAVLNTLVSPAVVTELLDWVTVNNVPVHVSASVNPNTGVVSSVVVQWNNNTTIDHDSGSITPFDTWQDLAYRNSTSYMNGDKVTGPPTIPTKPSNPAPSTVLMGSLAPCPYNNPYWD